MSGPESTLQSAPAVISRTKPSGAMAQPKPYMPPSAEHTDKLVASKLDHSVAAPATIALGDQLVGSHTMYETIIWNLKSSDAVVTAASVDGSPALTLVAAPHQIKPSGQGVDPENKFQIQFNPIARGPITGALHVSVSWPGGEQAPVELRVEIQGGAHEDGSMTLEDERAQRQQDEDRRKAADARGAAEREYDAAEEKRQKAKHIPKQQWAWHELDLRLNALEKAFGALYARRHVGLETAADEIRAYQKATPPHEPELLETLAKLALDVATAGIAGYVGKALEAPLKGLLATRIGALVNGKLEYTTAGDITPVVAVFTDAIKQGVKSVPKLVEATGSAARGARPGDPTPNATVLSINPMADFIAHQKLALLDEDDAEVTRTTARARIHFEPMLDGSEVEADRALAAVNAIKDTIQETTHGELVVSQQSTSTMRAWLEYLAQSSIGSASIDDARKQGRRTADGPTTAIENITAPPTATSAPALKPGLIDIEFGASVSHPEEPATLRRVMIAGVSDALAHHLAEQPLLASGLATRAHGVPSDGDAVMPVTVARDEAGNLSFTDNTRAPGSSGASWLARKAGAHVTSNDSEVRGARILMERELLNQPLDASMIHTDSKDKV